MIATSEVINCKNCSQLVPAAAKCVVRSVVFNPVVTPIIIGVPTAPNETGVDWIIIPIITAPRAGKPKPTNNGAAIAAGVPKPEAPSIKLPNNQAMIIT